MYDFYNFLKFKSGELLSRNVPLSRTVQRPGEFVLVCPRAYTSSLCTGYAVSESVYYATTDWLEGAQQDFKVPLIHNTNRKHIIKI